MERKGPGALDWLLRTNLPLMQAVRHHRAGDATKAMAAFAVFVMAEVWVSMTPFARPVVPPV